MTTKSRITLLAAALVVLVAGLIVASSLGGGNTKDAKAATIVVKGGKPVGGVQKITFKKGGTIDLTVKSDVADEVHFHGYDVHKDVDAGGSVRFRMPAKLDGRFEVELENAKQQLAEVTVQ